MILATQKAKIKPVHPFPARMAPSIVWDKVLKSDEKLAILDPMSGSGTTLVCAKLSGHSAIGCDTDPLALLIAKAWCSDCDPERVMYRAELVLKRAKKLNNRQINKVLYPKNADAETCKFIDFWFDSDNRNQLSSLATCISRVHSENERVFLWCAFSRMIITKKSGVSLAMDVSHSRPHRVYEVAPVKPFNSFLKAVSRVIQNCPFTENETKLMPVDIRSGDARKLPVKSSSIDMIITSPPYLNAIDYLRGHKLSLVWMGYQISEIRTLRSENIGTEVSKQKTSSKSVQNAMDSMGDLKSLDKRRFGMVQRFVCDMNLMMGECARVLKSKGRAIFVVGDSSIRGVFIKNSEGLIQLAKINGLSLVSSNTRPIETKRRYLPSPEYKKAGEKMQSRMREEVILEFQVN